MRCLTIPLILWGTGIIDLLAVSQCVGQRALFALGYFSVMLLPVLGFLNNLFHAVFAKWPITGSILPSIGPIALWPRLSGSPYWEPRSCLVLGVLTWKQCGMYTDTETLWRATLRQKSRLLDGASNLGSACLQKGATGYGDCLS